jgi:hypothetical protein
MKGIDMVRQAKLGRTIAPATNDVDFRFLTQRRKDHLKGAEIFSSLFAPLR